MKPASLAQIRAALKNASNEELQELCLQVARYKVENKELLSYLLFDADDEDQYIALVCEEMDRMFSEINENHLYYIKKGVRKALRFTRKQIRFSKRDETEVALLLHFVQLMQRYRDHFSSSTAFRNIHDRQLQQVKKQLKKLHPDIQLDYKKALIAIDQR